MLYIINSPILTSFGSYTFLKITVKEAKRKIRENGGQFTSAIGHTSTSKLLSRLLGVEVPVSRTRITMEPGDEAIVFRLLERLPEGKVLTEAELEKVKFELGFLRRLKYTVL